MGQKWLKIGTTNSIERGEMQTVSSNNFTTTGSVIGGAYYYDPTVPDFYENDADAPPDMLAAEQEGYLIRNSEGKIYGSSQILQSNLWNPLGMIDNYDNLSWRTNVNGTLYADLMPVKGLTFTSRLGYRLGTTYISNYTSSFYWNTNQKMLHGQLSSSMYHNIYYQWENFANYILDIGKHNFSAMAGMQYASERNEAVGASTDRLTSDAPNFRYLNYSASDAIDNVSGNYVPAPNISYFGRLGWSYDGKYILQGSFRADAFDASKLSKENRWGYFPSVSAGWVLTNESFMKNLNQNFLSFLKLRASWGINGSVSSLTGYPYTTSMSLGGAIGFYGRNYYSFTDKLYTGASPSYVLPNEDLSWEESTQTDIGFDARFFGDRLSFGFDYYKKITTGLLGRVSAPAISGTTTQVINMGKIENYGYEFELGWKDNLGKLSYGIDVNLSTVHNEVLESPYGEGRLGGGGGFLTTATYFEKGYPIWYIRTYMIDHIDPLTGQPVYKTAEELGSDDGRAYSGSGIPDFIYGFTLNLAYRGFDFRAFGTGAQGSELYLALIRLDLPKCNLPQYMYEDRWTLDNTDATKPSSTVFLGGQALYAVSDDWVFNSSYFKIKQLQLGYTFPAELTKRVKISSLRIFTSLENFFTFTKYPGNDPESMAGTGAGMTFYGFTVGGGLSVDQVQYPSMKQVSFGVNVSF
jgi:TonB-linked SusC/RagA family outer membrane protein